MLGASQLFHLLLITLVGVYPLGSLDVVTCEGDDEPSASRVGALAGGV